MSDLFADTFDYAEDESVFGLVFVLTTEVNDSLCGTVSIGPELLGEVSIECELAGTIGVEAELQGRVEVGC